MKGKPPDKWGRRLSQGRRCSASAASSAPGCGAGAHTSCAQSRMLPRAPELAAASGAACGMPAARAASCHRRR